MDAAYDWGDTHYRAGEDFTRHESHAANTRTAASLDAAKVMLMPYRHNKLAAVQPGFEFKPGYIYTQVRAITARINQNYDGWPSDELKKSYKTFIGKPIFVNHQNFDPKLARGKVVAARYYANGDDKGIETVMEVDAQRFPKLAHEIKTGGMDSVSMGVEAGFTICSYCNNKAVDEPEFCSHVRYHKGRVLPRINEKTGAKEDVLVYEKCYKLGFFELSYVFDPADETAVVSRVISAGLHHAADPGIGDTSGAGSTTGQFQDGVGMNDAISGADTHPDDPMNAVKPLRPMPSVGNPGKTQSGLGGYTTGGPFMTPNMYRDAHNDHDMDKPLDFGGGFDGYPAGAHGYQNADGHWLPGKEPHHHGAAAPPPPMDMPEGNMPTDPMGMPTSQIEARINQLMAKHDWSWTPEQGAAEAERVKHDPQADPKQVDRLDEAKFGPDHPKPAQWKHVYPHDPGDEPDGLKSMLGDAISEYTYEVPGMFKEMNGMPAPWGRDDLNAKPGDAGYDINSHQAAKDWSGPLEYSIPEYYPPEGSEEHAIREHKNQLSRPHPQEDWDGPLEYKIPTDREGRRRRHAYGEIEAPEDIDTLRDDQGDTQDDDFKHFVESPKELQGPDLDQTKLRDQQQEEQGLDRDRRAEDVEDVGGLSMSARNRRRSAADANAWDYDDYGAGEESRQAHPPHHESYPEHPYHGEAGGWAGKEATVLVDPRTGRRYYAADSSSDSDLISEAEDDLEKADKASKDDFSDDPGSDAGGSDDDSSDSDDDDDDSDDDDSDSDSDSDSDLPPWLKGKSKGGGDDDDSDGPPPPPSSKESRRNGNRRSSNQKKRGKGAPMTLQTRGRTATAGRRRHYADDNGHVDGGPYNTDSNDQGVNDGITTISDTPGGEAVSAPKPGDGTISNNPSNLVANLSRRIQHREAELRRDLIAYEQITGRRVTAGDGDDGNWPNSPAQSGNATEDASTVNPKVQDPAAVPLTNKGFDDIALDHAETQPDNGRSARAFRAFDQWLVRATGRTASQHNNPNFIRRSAARYCQASGVRVESLFPTLGSVLREARRNEGGNMRHRADAGAPVEYAAPQDRIDPTKPTNNTTDADAQASQFPLKDFGGNASDGLADPDLSTDSQIWAPGETPAGFGTKKDSNRKADGITAVRYAEAFIAAGLAPNTSEEKWKIAGLAQTMRHGTIVDRISLLDAVNTTRQAAARRTAGANRGAARPLPQGLGQRQLTGGSTRMAANDIATDQAMFFK